MQLSTLIRICKLHRDMGSMVGDQLDGFMDGYIGDQNPNALKHIRDRLLKPAERMLRGSNDTDEALADEIAELITEMDDEIESVTA